MTRGSARSPTPPYKERKKRKRAGSWTEGDGVHQVSDKVAGLKGPSASAGKGGPPSKANHNDHSDHLIIAPTRGARAAMMALDARNRQKGSPDGHDDGTGGGQSSGGIEQLQEELAEARLAAEGAKQQLERLTKENTFKNDVIESQRSALTCLYEQASCHVCLDLAWRPHVLNPCGHTFCAPCLVGWFKQPLPNESPPSGLLQLEDHATLKRKKVCPHCRTQVTGPPTEVYAVKGMVHRLHQCQMLGQIAGEAAAPSNIPQKTAAEEEKSHTGHLPLGPAVWDGIFDANLAKKIYDPHDAVYRCSLCLGEVAYGECQTCGEPFSTDGSEYGDIYDTESAGDSLAASYLDAMLDTRESRHGVTAPEDSEGEGDDHSSEMDGFIVDDDDEYEDESGLARSSRRFGYSSEENSYEPSDESDFDDTTATNAARHASSNPPRIATDDEESGIEFSDDDDDDAGPSDSRRRPGTRQAAMSTGTRRNPAVIADSDEDEEDLVSNTLPQQFEDAEDSDASPHLAPAYSDDEDDLGDDDEAEEVFSSDENNDDDDI